MSRSIERQIRKSVKQKSIILEKHMDAYREALVAMLYRDLGGVLKELKTELEKGNIDGARDIFSILAEIFSEQGLTGVTRSRNVNSTSTSDSPCVP